MNRARGRRGGRVAVLTAVAGTVLIAAGAFWLSFTALADLARRSGVEAGQAWAWPLIVDGIIVVATVAVVALAGSRVVWYPWMLLIVGAGLSVTANGVHAIVAADADVPPVLAAAVAAVPPLVLLAITHLTVILTRHQPGEAENSEPEPLPEHEADAQAEAVPVPASAVPLALRIPSIRALGESEPSVPASDSSGTPLTVAGSSGRAIAEALRAGGWSNKKIARSLGVHPSTVGRWFAHVEPGISAEVEHHHDQEAAMPVPGSNAPQLKKEDPS